MDPSRESDDDWLMIGCINGVVPVQHVSLESKAEIATCSETVSSVLGYENRMFWKCGTVWVISDDVIYAWEICSLKCVKDTILCESPQPGEISH